MNVHIISKEPGIIVSHNSNPRFKIQMPDGPISVPERIGFFLTHTLPTTIFLYGEKENKIIKERLNEVREGKTISSKELKKKIKKKESDQSGLSITK